MNYESVYFAEQFLLNLLPCFDIAFAQLGIIPKTKSKFVEIVAVAECYLIRNHVKKKQPFQKCLPVKLADGRMSVKKETEMGKRYLAFLQFTIIIDMSQILKRNVNFSIFSFQNNALY